MINTAPTTKQRSSGVLLHVTSLPSDYGIGDLGPSAFAWIETLARAGQSWWQILPLAPTGYGDSPYQCFSAFAGNPLLISPELLHRDGLLVKEEFENATFSAERVEFERVIPWKTALLDRAWRRFGTLGNRELTGAYDCFCGENAAWLDDFVLFMALKEAHDGVSWQQWPDELRCWNLESLDRCRHHLRDRIFRHKFVQFAFFRQWKALREHARACGVNLIGDMPLFVALDSVDVWAQPELFLLDAQRRPTFVAGVPPDYFSITGQRWGNPLYDWHAHRQTGYAWWIARLRATLAMVDLVRLDHFRGFEAAWHIPAKQPTAQTGKWVAGPGADFLEFAQRSLGGLPFIAEDLGFITPAVENLRNRFELPGMRILQFAYGGAREDRFLPKNYERNTVVYTGTHDNDTAMGWYFKLTTAEHRYFRDNLPGVFAAGDLLRAAWESVANLAMAPLQDVLGLDNFARMNTPGQPNGNWRWRFTAQAATDSAFGMLGELTAACKRSPQKAGDARTGRHAIPGAQR